MSLGIGALKEKVKGICESTIDSVLANRKYNPEASIEWANNISNNVATKLREFEGYKYFVNTCLVTREGTALNISGACLWNPEKDGAVVAKKEVGDMIAIVTAFFLNV